MTAVAKPPHDRVAARVMLALATGGLIAATGATLAHAAPATVTGAVVTRTASCAEQGRDTIRVDTPDGEVTTTLDACGRPVDSRVEVLLNADGSAGELVSLAATRSAPAAGAAPVVVLAVGALAVLAGAASSVRAGRGRRIQSSQ